MMSPEEGKALHKEYFLWRVVLAVVTMETPVPGLVPVGGDVTAHVDDIILRDGRVDEDRRIGEETPTIQRH